MVRIAHLSDLHCGSDYILRAAYERRLWWNVFNTKAATNIKSEVERIKPDIIVITGDFVNKPSVGNFKEAIAVIKQFCSPLTNFDFRERLLLVPGNHDIPWLDRQRDPYSRSIMYRNFVAKLLDIPVYNIRLNYWKLFPDYRLCFFALDSTRVETKGIEGRLSIADGEIGKNQLGWFEQEMKFLQNAIKDFNHYYKIVLLHHHPYPIPGAPPDRNQQLCDMGDLQYKLWDFEVHLVLHGHRHYPHFTRHPNRHKLKKGVYICGAGTAGCALEGEQCGFGNNFHLIEFRGDGKIDEDRIPV